MNLLWLTPGVVGGSEEYTVRTLLALAEADPADLELTLFAQGELARVHPRLAAAFPTVAVELDGRRKALRVAAESTWLAAQARRRRIELLHHAGGVAPPGCRTPYALTIHDLQPLERPEQFSAAKRRYLAALLPRSARRARLVLTPSAHAAAAVTRLLGVPAARPAVVPHGGAAAPGPA
ncbi:MAG: glycosyltransferase, partial [Acidimicrobiales bacterium]